MERKEALPLLGFRRPPPKVACQGRNRNRAEDGGDEHRDDDGRATSGTPEEGAPRIRAPPSRSSFEEFQDAVRLSHPSCPKPCAPGEALAAELETRVGPCTASSLPAHVQQDYAAALLPASLSTLANATGVVSR